MSWFDSAANQAAAARKSGVGLAIAVDFDFPSGHTRLSTWSGPLTIGGNEYVGMGALGSVATLRDGIGLDAQRRAYKLQLKTDNGASVPLASIPESELRASRGRAVAEYLCFIDVDSGQLIDEPEMPYEGLVSSAQRVSGATPSVQIVTVSRLIFLEKTDGWRWTDSHQQGAFYNLDLGFQYVDRNDKLDISWGGILVRPGTPPGGHPNPSVNPRQPV